MIEHLLLIQIKEKMMNAFSKEKTEKNKVLELMFECDNINNIDEQDEVFDAYGNYLFPTETVLERPNIISGVVVI